VSVWQRLSSSVIHFPPDFDTRGTEASNYRMNPPGETPAGYPERYADQVTA